METSRTIIYIRDRILCHAYCFTESFFRVNCETYSKPFRKINSPDIGIDIGTTYSSVSVFKHNDIEFIPNDSGKLITPSCVAFTETERLIGDAAKGQLITNPSNTVFAAKRLIGRSFDDLKVQTDIKFWPFKVVTDDGKRDPSIQPKIKQPVTKWPMKK